MNAEDEVALKNTRAKLERLEAMYRRTSEDATEEPRVRERSLRSLRRLINQLKEEIFLMEHQRMAG